MKAQGKALRATRAGTARRVVRRPGSQTIHPQKPCKGETKSLQYATTVRLHLRPGRSHLRAAWPRFDIRSRRDHARPTLTRIDSHPRRDHLGPTLPCLDMYTRRVDVHPVVSNINLRISAPTATDTQNGQNHQAALRHDCTFPIVCIH
jgi:hypothetical protein